jgi:hypothetical protein
MRAVLNSGMGMHSFPRNLFVVNYVDLTCYNSTHFHSFESQGLVIILTNTLFDEVQVESYVSILLHSVFPAIANLPGKY